MNCRQLTPQPGLIFLLLLLAISLPIEVFAADEMASEKDFVGFWSGMLTTADQGDIAVDLTVVAPENSRSTFDYSFHYGPPRSCKLSAKKAAQEENTLYLIFDEASGGFCDKLWRESMSLELLEAHRVLVRIQKASIDLSEVDVLEKQE